MLYYCGVTKKLAKPRKSSQRDSLYSRDKYNYCMALYDDVKNTMDFYSTTQVKNLLAKPTIIVGLPNNLASQNFKHMNLADIGVCSTNHVITEQCTDGFKEREIVSETSSTIPITFNANLILGRLFAGLEFTYKNLFVICEKQEEDLLIRIQWQNRWGNDCVTDYRTCLRQISDLLNCMVKNNKARTDLKFALSLPSSDVIDFGLLSVLKLNNMPIKVMIEIDVGHCNYIRFNSSCMNLIQGISYKVDGMNLSYALAQGFNSTLYTIDLQSLKPNQYNFKVAQLIIPLIDYYIMYGCVLLLQIPDKAQAYKFMTCLHENICNTELYNLGDFKDKAQIDKVWKTRVGALALMKTKEHRACFVVNMVN